MNLKIKNPFLWTSILTNGGALLISLFIFQTEPCIRIFGMGLQLLGVISIIWGISETRELFGEPSFFRIIKNKVVSMLSKRNITIHPDSGHIKMTGNSPRISQRNSPFGNNPTLKERVLSLEKNIYFINDDIKKLQEEMDIQGSDIHKRINDKTKLLQTEIEQINKKLKESATGGIHISALGAIWFFIGILLSSLAPELAKWLN